MIVTHLKSDDKAGRVKVFIDGEYAFFLNKKELQQYKLEEGRVIDERLYEDLIENIIYPAAKEKALSILGYSDKTEKELRLKLEKADFIADIINRVVSCLSIYGYINDERYARAYIFSNKQKKSKPAIMAQLINKGISKDIIEKVMSDEYNEDDSTDDELIAIRKAIAKKTSFVEALDFTQKQKLMASLYRKGFELEKIRKALE